MRTEKCVSVEERQVLQMMEEMQELDEAVQSADRALYRDDADASQKVMTAREKLKSFRKRWSSRLKEPAPTTASWGGFRQ